MTRDELLDWAQVTGRIAPTADVRDAWGRAYDLDAAGTEARLWQTPAANALALPDEWRCLFDPGPGWATAAETGA